VTTCSCRERAYERSKIASDTGWRLGGERRGAPPLRHPPAAPWRRAPASPLGGASPPRRRHWPPLRLTVAGRRRALCDGQHSACPRGCVRRRAARGLPDGVRGAQGGVRRRPHPRGQANTVRRTATLAAASPAAPRAGLATTPCGVAPPPLPTRVEAAARRSTTPPSRTRRHADRRGRPPPPPAPHTRGARSIRDPFRLRYAPAPPSRGGATPPSRTATPMEAGAPQWRGRRSACGSGRLPSHLTRGRE